jgi:hypothetical protein
MRFYRTFPPVWPRYTTAHRSGSCSGSLRGPFRIDPSRMRVQCHVIARSGQRATGSAAACPRPAAGGRQWLGERPPLGLPRPTAEARQDGRGKALPEC